MLGATAEQIESAIGLTVSHFVPFRAIRHGEQLSDSKGASAAISAEVAVQSMRRAMRGFVGPADIFRNPQAVFCLFEKPAEPGCSPFDLELATGGSDFAVMGMHFKLGLYEHQSAGAIGGLFELLSSYPLILKAPKDIERIRITIYEPAFSIIGDPHKRDPRMRQSADHSMVYIVATLLRKAMEAGVSGQGSGVRNAVDFWRDLMLVPADYDDAALFHPLTRALMDKIEFLHGGPEYDAKYPDGIPTLVEIDHLALGRLSSGLVMYPEGHARNSSGYLQHLLRHKFRALASLGVRDVDELLIRFSGLASKSANELRSLYDFEIAG
jgi:2-methylcitrate dehydratase